VNPAQTFLSVPAFDDFARRHHAESLSNPCVVFDHEVHIPQTNDYIVAMMCPWTLQVDQVAGLVNPGAARQIALLPSEDVEAELLDSNTRLQVSTAPSCSDPMHALPTPCTAATKRRLPSPWSRPAGALTVRTLLAIRGHLSFCSTRCTLQPVCTDCPVSLL
jgi:hypothetical protein